MAVVGRIANGLAAIGGAGFCSQFPEFYQQYIQRLGGRLDQALVQEARIYEAAQSQGLTVPEYVDRFLQSEDPVFQAEGELLLQTLADAEHLRAALLELANASPLERPVTFFQHMDADLFRATLEAYVPAMPVSVEGLTYAALGMLLGLVLLAGAERSGKSVARRVKQHRRRHKERRKQRPKQRQWPELEP